MNPKILMDSSYCPNPIILELLSVKIECVNTEGTVLNNGTGTLFFCGNSYYVITAAHCIQYDDTLNHYDKANIKITLPRICNNIIIEVNDVLDFNLDDITDFALLSVKCDIDKLPINFDYENGISFLNGDDFGINTCIYGYTSSYPLGRKFQTRMVSSDTYSIDENITATGVDFARVMKGSSGGGIFVGYEDRIYCLGYVKSRMTEMDRLDDIKIRRIPNEINDKLPYPILRSSIIQNQSLFLTTRSNVEIKYINKWNDLSIALSQKEDVTGILDEIVELRTQYPYAKTIRYQEQITNTILRIKNQWRPCEQRAFIYALQDRGLWPTLFKELPNAGDLNNVPEFKNMMLRASTFACGLTDEIYVPNKNTNEGMYELILREAYKFEFDKMYELLNEWNPSEVWVVKKALLINLFKKDEDILNSVKSFIENRNNSASERFVASLIYNVTEQQIPQSYNYTEFWENGVEAPSEIISYIAVRIDKTKVQPKIFGTHSAQVWGSGDSTSFPESIRLLQFVVNSGLTTKLGIYNIVDIEYWMKAFRHLIHFIPYPTVYYTLQYAEEKTVRWAGQIIAYSNNDFFIELRPNLLNTLLRALRMKHLPKHLFLGLYYLTQELYTSVHEDMWYDEFKQSILDFFIIEIDAKNVSASDAIYKNLFSAIQCVKNQERRKEIFCKLTTKITQNIYLIGRLLCNALWVDSKFAAIDEVSKCLWIIINEYPIYQSYNILYEFNRVNSLTEEQKGKIDNKIAKEQLSFSKSDYIALVYLSHLVLSPQSISKIKQIVLTGDIWNCGITDSYYTDPSPFHIEEFNEKVIWTEKEWEQIRLNMEHNIELIEKKKLIGESSNFYNCMYLDLLSDMRLFMVRLKQKNGYNVDDMINRVDASIAKLSGFGNLMEALSSDNYNKVNAALNLLNIYLKNDSFEKHKSEINLIINKVTLKQSANIDNCIDFIAFLMQHYPKEMKTNFGDLLLCLLGNYINYDFEEMNFRVPVVNHRLSLIAHRMKPEFGDNLPQVRYWTSDEVINRFGGFETLR